VKQLVSYEGSPVMADGVTPSGRLSIYYSSLG